MSKSWFALLMALALNCAARPADPPNSIYHLEVQLTNQRGQVHGLDVHRGHPVLISMFYGGCAATCPLIIETLRSAENAATPAQRANLRVLMISLDSERDTVPALQELAKARRIDTTRWTLARADERTVRNVAALLNVQYRKLPSGEFSHSTMIVLLSATGEIEISSSKLGVADPALVEALRR